MGGAPAIVWLRDGVGYTPDAAASMRRLEAALGRAHDCNSSYRDYDLQRSMFDAWNRYVDSGYNPRYKPNHSRAIDPDKSMHCKGLADDSDDWTTPGYIDLAAEHGWIRTAANDPTERHHFEYQWWNDQHRNDPAPASTEASKKDEDIMTAQDVAQINANTNNRTAIVIRDIERNSIFFADEWGADHILDFKTDDIGLAEFITAIERVYGIREVSARDFDIAVAVATRRWNAKLAALAAVASAGR